MINPAELKALRDELKAIEERPAEMAKKLENMKPTLPDAVVEYYAQVAGIPPEQLDPRVANLVAIASQKFIADIVSDAMMQTELAMDKKKREHFAHQGVLAAHCCLTNETVRNVLLDYGINVTEETKKE
ncbi:hypothetical protein QR680_018816 [Steinernema hermaphroditum]|uniref:Transcription initiation factor TFIID subunit 10 n=1 Tax=Steinernema hermaphroditum TaxID=289476 RepID=A0AA39HK16_9BILA|nr:hypothetical protein QR680_018816 [Steinernema hermaphroditum]